MASLSLISNCLGNLLIGCMFKTEDAAALTWIKSLTCDGEHQLELSLVAYTVRESPLICISSTEQSLLTIKGSNYSSI